MKNKTLIIIGIILLVIMFSGKKEFKKMAGECGTVPTDGCTVSSSTTFTPGVYNLPNGITINANNVVLDCSGASLVGSGAGYGIADSYGRTNVTIINCDISGYRDAIFAKTQTGFLMNFSLINSSVYNSQCENIYLGGARGVLIDGLNSYNGGLNSVSVCGGVNKGHGLYIDAGSVLGSKNIEIRNSNFFNNTGEGIQINSANVAWVNFSYIHHCSIFNNTDNGINDLAGFSGTYSFNTISGNVGGIALYTSVTGGGVYPSTNNLIFNNLFSNNQRDYWFGNWSQNNSIYNNQYSSSTISVQGKGQNMFNEDMGYLTVNYSYYSSYVKFSYSGRKDILVTDNTLKINSIPSNMALYESGTKIADVTPGYSFTVAPNKNYEISAVSTSSSSSGGGGSSLSYPSTITQEETNTTTPITITPAQPKKESNWLAYTLVIAAIYFMRKKK